MRDAIVRVETLMSYRRRSLCDNQHMREISLPQFHVLVTLQERGALTVSELAHLLDTSAPSASSLVDRMEENGFVHRERSTTDRRIVHVFASEHGRKVVEELMGMKRDRLLKLFEVMTDDEIRAIIGGIDALTRGLNRLAEHPPADLSAAV
jgi:DNA-binding MarR family transcriptional regulator